ncbi:MAG: hypothetical protein RR290_04305 [Clostridia bacterium]
MSKLYDKYKKLKNEDSNKVYLFKNGIFFIAIDSDALLLQEKLNLKVTNLNNEILKCGFPVNSLNIYVIKLIQNNLDFKFIDEKYDTITSPEAYLNSIKIEKIISIIQTTDMDNTSPKDAYNILIKLQDNLNELEEAING